MAGSFLFAALGPAPENLSIFDPVSPQASAIRDLAVLVLAITGFIFLVVEGTLIYSIVRFRRAKTPSASEPPQVYGSHAIEIAWTVAPVLIVIILILVVARTEWEVRAEPPAPRAGDNALYVTVVGRQWWWEYRYETYNGTQLDFIAANELHVPACDPGEEGVQRPVHLTLLSADVCHSFWVPRLAGKTDLLPGRTNRMSFRTSQQGLFLGQCAEFCGTQHAKMLLRVQVDAPAEFDAWVKGQQREAKTPTGTNEIAGMKTFLKTSCVDCHRVGGTSARGSYAPDLTHLMSRQTLASGIMPNTAENLKNWILDPQKDKPGCLMAGFRLGDEAMDQMVAYLRTLE